MTGDAIARLIALVEHLQTVVDLQTANGLRQVCEAAQADLDALRAMSEAWCQEQNERLRGRPKPPTTETRQ